MVLRRPSDDTCIFFDRLYKDHMATVEAENLYLGRQGACRILRGNPVVLRESYAVAEPSKFLFVFAPTTD